ncbi:MAG TPA: type I-E CRISPR-associated protein Cas6/Cse3/CasE [Chthoniobacterales bacterium]|nr:type I-E CRISPR-associated protein Cas6/Cse3/CasE [Chthoniobacterales bacterium]
MSNDAPNCWLTRAIITPRTLFSRGIRDAYAWHQLVWQAFPGRDGTTRDFLTRLDDKPGGAQLLIVSPVEPSRPDWLGATDSWESKPIPPAYFQARRYRFQLRANPTHKPVKGADGQYIADAKKRKRRAITGDDELAAWLRRKGEGGGFRLCESVPLEIWCTAQRFEKRRDGEVRQCGVHAAVDFSGVIEIVDCALFLSATFSKGIGSAKAFGFGLLVLAPLERPD